MEFFAVSFVGMICGYFLTEIGSIREEGWFIFDDNNPDHCIFKPTKTLSYFFRRFIKFLGQLVMIASALLVLYGIYVVFVSSKASSCGLMIN